MVACLTKGELGILVVKGTPAVNEDTKVLIYGRVIGEDVETVEGAVSPVSVETGIAMVAPTGVDTFKSHKGEVTCKDYSCEDDCEEDCNALFIYLIILVEFGVFYMTYMIYVDLC